MAVLEAIGGFGFALQVGLDGFVLFVELSEIGDEVFDDIGMGKGVDAGFLGGLGGDTACGGMLELMI